MHSGVSRTIVGRLLKFATPDSYPKRFRLRFRSDIAVVELRQCDRKAGFDHSLRHIDLLRFAGGYDPIIVVDIALLTSQVYAAHQLRQFLGRLPAACPTLPLARTGLIELRCVNAMEANDDPRHVDGVAIRGSSRATNVLRNCRKWQKREPNCDKPLHAKKSSTGNLPIS